MRVMFVMACLVIVVDELNLYGHSDSVLHIFSAAIWTVLAIGWSWTLLRKIGRVILEDIRND